MTMEVLSDLLPVVSFTNRLNDCCDYRASEFRGESNRVLTKCQNPVLQQERPSTP